jgi:invasion protein IalB
MKSSSRLIALFLLCHLGASAAAARADEAKSLGKTGDWESFSYSDHGAKVCYAATVLKSSQKGPKKRSLAIITLTNRPADKSMGVVSINPGVALKKGVAPGLAIGAAKFELYVQGKSVWTNDDKAVAAAMLKGKYALFHATPDTGAPFVDSYSLAGFDKAKAAIDSACPAK